MCSEAEQLAFRGAAARARGPGQAALDAGSIDIERWLTTYIFTSPGTSCDASDEDEALELASPFKMPRRLEPASEDELLMSFARDESLIVANAPTHDERSVGATVVEDAPSPCSVYAHALTYRISRTPPLAHIETVAAASGLLRALAANVARHVRAVNAASGDTLAHVFARAPLIVGLPLLMFVMRLAPGLECTLNGAAERALDAALAAGEYRTAEHLARTAAHVTERDIETALRAHDEGTAVALASRLRAYSLEGEAFQTALALGAHRYTAFVRAIAGENKA